MSQYLPTPSPLSEHGLEVHSEWIERELWAIRSAMVQPSMGTPQNVLELYDNQATVYGAGVTLVSWAAVEDTGSKLDSYWNSADPTNVIIPKGCSYITVTAMIYEASITAGTTGLIVSLNSFAENRNPRQIAYQGAASTETRLLSAGPMFHNNVGYLQLYVLNNTGSNLTAAANRTRMWVQFL